MDRFGLEGRSARSAKSRFTSRASAGLVAAIAMAMLLSAGPIPVATASVAAPAAASPLAGRQQQAAKAYANLPVSFVENRGQIDARARYYAQGDRFGFFLTPRRIVMSLAQRQRAEHVAVALRFLGGRPNVEPQGVERAAGVVNDLRGSDPSQWRRGIPQYRQVVYRNLWSGIDLRLRDRSGVLKYEFLVRPGASPSDIQLAYGGADGLTLGDDGGLRIATSAGALRDSAPITYQDIDGARVPVTSSYVLGRGANAAGRFSFAVGDYRRDHALVIDPGVKYSTFLGGNSAETGAGIAVDAAGNVIVAGTTQSPNFPTTSGAFDRTGAASNFADVFVSKLNAAGTALIYSTFVGGSNMEFGNRLAVDAGGNAYVTGTTKSSNFPTTGGAFDRTQNIPPNCPRCATDVTDGFVFKLNAAGSALRYSTYLGGTEDDSPRGIAVDGSGNAYVTGETLSSDFPTRAGSFQRTRRGQNDVFVTKLNPTGSALVYSTFLGGSAVDNGEQVQVDGGGNAYVLGSSSSADFPTTAGAFDTTANGGFDATLTKLNPAGSALVYSTFIGTNNVDGGSGLVIDGTGSAYVTGAASSANWPTTPGAYDTDVQQRGRLRPEGEPGRLRPGVLDVHRRLGLRLDQRRRPRSGGQRVADGRHELGRLPGHRRRARHHLQRGRGRDHRGAEPDRVGAPVRHVPGRLELGGRCGHRPRCERGHLRRRIDPLAGLPGDGRRVRPGVERRPPDLLGRRVHHQDRHRRHHVDADVASRRAGRADADISVQRLIAAAADHVRLERRAGGGLLRIQIDDSSGFSAPLERDQSLTQSIFAATGLAAGTHFWRVRGINSVGTAGPWSAVRSFTAQTPPPAAALTNVDINPTTVVGGDSSSGTIIMSAGPAADAVISLSSSNPSVASVPATTTVPANSFTGSFVISTSAVSSPTSAVITATYNGSSRTGDDHGHTRRAPRP